MQDRFDEERNHATVTIITERPLLVEEIAEVKSYKGNFTENDSSNPKAMENLRYKYWKCLDYHIQ